MSKDNCYHCGLDCKADKIEFDQKSFCCKGCRMVYEILNQHELSCYYDLETAPGSVPIDIKGKFDYLDNEDIASKLIEFDDLETVVVNFFIPTLVGFIPFKMNETCPQLFNSHFSFGYN